MKVCPVCRAVAFDDAEVCFGCLHDFSEDDWVEEAKQEEEPQRAPARTEALPEFLIRFTPVADASGGVTWQCVVEA